MHIGTGEGRGQVGFVVLSVNMSVQELPKIWYGRRPPWMKRTVHEVEMRNAPMRHSQCEHQALYRCRAKSSMHWQGPCGPKVAKEDLNHSPTDGGKRGCQSVVTCFFSSQAERKSSHMSYNQYSHIIDGRRLLSGPLVLYQTTQKTPTATLDGPLVTLKLTVAPRSHSLNS